MRQSSRLSQPLKSGHITALCLLLSSSPSFQQQGRLIKPSMKLTVTYLHNPT